MTSGVGKALNDAADVFEERNLVYADAYLKVGEILRELFPQGVSLVTAEDHNRYHLLVLIIVKLTRYAPNWSTGHEDSLKDIMVYAAMLQDLDKPNSLKDPEELRRKLMS